MRHVSTLRAAEPSQRSLIELDARVHRFVYRCSRNPYLERDLDRYLNMSLRIWRLTWDRLPPLRDRVGEHCRLLELIRAKAEGQPLPEPAQEQEAEVVDLMAALRESVEKTKKKRRATSKRKAS